MHFLRCFQGWLGIALLCLLASLVGCSGGTPTPLPPSEIIEGALGRMEQLAGFHYVIERSGAPAFLDTAGTLAFRRAEGDFVAPDRTQAQIRVIGPGLIAEVQVISIGDQQWETNVLTGAWVKLPPEWGFNPARWFDPKEGIHPVLKGELSDLRLEGIAELEDLPGDRFYLLTARVKGERLYRLSYGMMGPDSMDLRLWIAPETFDLVRLKITDPQPDQTEATFWQIDFWDFDRVAEISPPVVQEATREE
jgi:hypothetical protein